MHHRIATIATLLLLNFAWTTWSGAPAARASVPTQAGHPIRLEAELGGPLRDIALDDRFVYAIVGRRVVLRPRGAEAGMALAVSEPWSGGVSAIAPAGRRLLMGTGLGNQQAELLVLDVADTGRTTVAARLRLPAAPRGVSWDGQHAWLALGLQGAVAVGGIVEGAPRVVARWSMAETPTAPVVSVAPVEGGAMAMEASDGGGTGGGQPKALRLSRLLLDDRGQTSMGGRRAMPGSTQAWGSGQGQVVIATTSGRYTTLIRFRPASQGSDIEREVLHVGELGDVWSVHPLGHGVLMLRSAPGRSLRTLDHYSSWPRWKLINSYQLPRDVEPASHVTAQEGEAVAWVGGPSGAVRLRLDAPEEPPTWTALGAARYVDVAASDGGAYAARAPGVIEWWPYGGQQEPRKVWQLAQTPHAIAVADGHLYALVRAWTLHRLRITEDGALVSEGALDIPLAEAPALVVGDQIVALVGRDRAVAARTGDLTDPWAWEVHPARGTLLPWAAVQGETIWLARRGTALPTPWSPWLHAPDPLERGISPPPGGGGAITSFFGRERWLFLMNARRRLIGFELRPGRDAVGRWIVDLPGVGGNGAFDSGWLWAAWRGSPPGLTLLRARTDSITAEDDLVTGAEITALDARGPLAWAVDNDGGISRYRARSEGPPAPSATPTAMGSPTAPPGGSPTASATPVSSTPTPATATATAVPSVPSTPGGTGDDERVLWLPWTQRP